MDGAEQLKRDTIPFVPRAQSAGVEPPLQIAMNPFVAGMSGSRMGRPLQTAFGEVIRQIGEQTSIVVVVGSAGTGKSMLADMAARACAGMGLSVRRIERGDLVQTAFGEKSDVLLVDQTDSISNSSLQTLLSANGKSIATTMVFLCLPSCVSRFSFSGTQAAVVELTPLSLSDARNYLQERAVSIGRPNLFASEALDIVIDGSRGLPRLLRSIAQLAFFAAASEGASQICTNHVSNAVASQVLHDSQNADAGAPEKNVRHADNGPRDSVKSTPDAAVPRVAFENHKVDVVQTNNIDTASRLNPNRFAEPLAPRTALENQNSIADIAAHVRFATQKREPVNTLQVDAKALSGAPSPTVTSRTSTKALTDAPSLKVTPSAGTKALTEAPSPTVTPRTDAKVLTDAPNPRVTPSTTSPIAAPSVAAATSSPLPNVHVSDQKPRPMAAARAEKLQPKEGKWIARSVAITGVLAASFVVAGVISSNFLSGGTNSPKRAPGVLAISKPVDLTKAVVQAPVSDKQTIESTLPAQTAERAQTRDDAIANLIAKTPATADAAGTSKDAVTQQSKPEVVTRTRVATPVTSQPTRATRAAEEGAGRRLADDKTRAERDAADHVKSATDQKAAVIAPVPQTPRGTEAAGQTAAATQAAEEKAASDRAIAAQEKAVAEKAMVDRAVAAERAAQEKTAAEKALADRAKAAELAAVQEQETAKLAQEQVAARQVKAAKDAADKVAKDAADKARAEKMAEEQAKAARQESNRVFSHSLFGFNR